MDLKSPISLTDQYETIKPLLAIHGPAEFAPLREKGISEFEKVGIPTSRDEEFKYVPLRALSEDNYSHAYGANVSREAMEATLLGKLDAITITFVNGEHAPEFSSIDALPKGVYVGSIEEAIEGFGDKVLAHIAKIATTDGKLGSTNDDRFIHLNNAFLGEGAFVFVPKGKSIERPIHIQHLHQANEGAFAVYPRILIVLEDGSDAKVVESFSGIEGNVFTNAVSEVYLGKDAILEHTKLQAESLEAIHIGNIAVFQEEGSTYTSNNINFGGKIARHDVNVWIDGEHTETWLNGVNVGLGSQIIDNHTRIDHAKPNCHSFEVYKSILGDQSVGVFNGKIFVYEDAQKTDAKQTNQAILLSGEATMNTKPQLEIFADDVKCTHGATIGQLREDALFYLRARGIPLQEAKALLVYAFAAEVLEKITIHEVKDVLEAKLFDRLGIQTIE